MGCQGDFEVKRASHQIRVKVRDRNEKEPFATEQLLVLASQTACK